MASTNNQMSSSRNSKSSKNRDERNSQDRDVSEKSELKSTSRSSKPRKDREDAKSKERNRQARDKSPPRPLDRDAKAKERRRRGSNEPASTPGAVPSSGAPDRKKRSAEKTKSSSGPAATPGAVPSSGTRDRKKRGQTKSRSRSPNEPATTPGAVPSSGTQERKKRGSRETKFRSGNESATTPGAVPYSGTFERKKRSTGKTSSARTDKSRDSASNKPGAVPSSTISGRGRRKGGAKGGSGPSRACNYASKMEAFASNEAVPTEIPDDSEIPVALEATSIDPQAEENERIQQLEENNLPKQPYRVDDVMVGDLKPEEDAQQEDTTPTSFCRRQRKLIAALCVILLAVGVGVAASYFLTSGRATESHTDPLSTSNPPSTMNPASTMISSSPPPTSQVTSSPTNIVSEDLVYALPTPEDCEAMKRGLAVPGQDKMKLVTFDIWMDVSFASEVDIDPYLPNLDAKIQEFVAPKLAQCPSTAKRALQELSQRELQSEPYIIGNAIASIKHLMDESCEDESRAFCFRISVNLDIYLKGEESTLTLIRLVSDIFGTAPIVDLLQLNLPDVQIDIVFLNRKEPTTTPTIAPSPKEPTTKPTIAPSPALSSSSSFFPSKVPKENPSSPSEANPSSSPTQVPTILSSAPSTDPTTLPSSNPTRQPVVAPTTEEPTPIPSSGPSRTPSQSPSSLPTLEASSIPTGQPTWSPSKPPTSRPSASPSMSPSASPSRVPSVSPSNLPSSSPTAYVEQILTRNGLAPLHPEALDWLSMDDPWVPADSSVNPEQEWIERYVLAVLYYSTKGNETWTKADNWLSSQSVCDWLHITCNENGLITRLYMRGNRMSGTIPSEIGRLTDMRTWSFEGNSLVGSVPTEIGNLSILRDTRLAYNRLTGTIPSEIGSFRSTVYFYWHGNRLSGTLPSELLEMTAVNSLWIGSNLLTGTIPSEIGSRLNLGELQLQGNKLTGTIPVLPPRLCVACFGQYICRMESNCFENVDNGVVEQCTVGNQNDANRCE